MRSTIFFKKYSQLTCITPVQFGRRNLIFKFFGFSESLSNKRCTGALSITFENQQTVHFHRPSTFTDRSLSQTVHFHRPFTFTDRPISLFDSVLDQRPHLDNAHCKTLINVEFPGCKWHLSSKHFVAILVQNDNLRVHVTSAQSRKSARSNFRIIDFSIRR